MNCPAFALHAMALLQSVQVQDIGLKGLRDSFCKFHIERVAADIKESIGRVSDSLFNANENANIPTVSYEVGKAVDFSMSHHELKT